MSSLSSQSTEELARYYGWDEDLTRLLLSLPRPVVDQYILQTISYDKDGWRYILPGLPSPASVLCLDARYGTTAAALAETGAAVTVIHPCPVTVRIIRHRLAALKVSNVTVLHVAPKTTHLPFEDARFDAFVHHDVAGTLVTNPATAVSHFVTLTATLLNEAFRLVKPDGFAYFGTKNRHGYTEWRKRLLRRTAQEPPTISPTPMRHAKWLIRRAGFQDIRIHPYLVEQERVSEILPPSGYRSVKNSLLAGERLKQVFLGKIGSRFLAPAYGLVCAKGRPRAALIKSFADDLVAQGIMAAPADHQACFQRYFPIPGKVFVTLGKAVDRDENIIIVIPKISRVQTWRRKEIAIVNEVRTLSPYLAAKLPRQYTESSCRGETYFALSEIPGITIDRRVPRLDQLTHNAVEFLIRFNQITARTTALSPEAYSGLMAPLIRQVAEIYPETRERMDRIELHLRAAVTGKSIVRVWLHGDYKLENLIFDRDTLEITGIIDWEQSRREGLPWLDLLYLLAYNRIMTEGRDFFDVYHEVILGEDYADHEKAVMDAYARAMPLPSDMKTVLTALFFVHHIGFRYKYNMHMAGDRDNIHTALTELEMRLARLNQ